MMSSKSKLSKSLCEERRKYREKVLHSLCTEISYAAKTSKNGRVPYGLINKLISQTKNEEPWINRNVLNFAYKKFCQKMESLVLDTVAKVPGGRPKGSNNLSKHHIKEVVFAAKNEIAAIYLEEKEKYKKEGKKLPNNWLNNKIAEVSAIRGIPSVSINVATIRSRKGGNVLQGGGAETLMASVEPHLVELICAMAEIRRCLTASEAVALANDLIGGTKTGKKKLIETETE